MADFNSNDPPEGPSSDIRTSDIRTSDVRHPDVRHSDPQNVGTLSGAAVGSDPKMAGLMAMLLEARSAPLPAPSAEGSDDQRQQIAALAKSIRSVPALQARLTLRRRALWAGLSTLAVAAAAALFVTLPLGENAAPSAVVDNTAQQVLSLRQVVGKVIATHADGNDVVLRPDMGLQGGDQVSTTAEAFASLEFTAGTRVDLSSATTMKIVEAQELELRVGRVDINVPKVADGEARRLSVSTPNTTVVVRGTIFSVEVEAADTAAVTRVGVTRGAVAVFYAGKEHTVRAGEIWTSDKPLEKGTIGVSAAVAASPERGAPALLEPPVANKSPRLAPQPAQDPSPDSEEAESETVSSSLSQQNRLFARGLRARAQGDDARAAYWFEQLTSRFPDSPLAEAAIREHDAAVQRSKAQ